MKKILVLFLGLVSLATVSCSTDDSVSNNEEKIVGELLENDVIENDQNVYEFRKYSLSQDNQHYYFYNVYDNNEVKIDLNVITHSQNGINYGTANLLIKLNGVIINHPAEYSQRLSDKKIAVYSTNNSENVYYEFESDF